MQAQSNQPTQENLPMNQVQIPENQEDATKSHDKEKAKHFKAVRGLGVRINKFQIKIIFFN